MERLKPLPGFYERCGDCRKHRKNPTESDLYCNAARVSFNVTLQPKIEVGADGTFTCDSYRPNLSIRIRNLVNEISLFAANSGIQLPQ